MNDSEILDRLALLAIERLKSAPGASTAFQNDLIHSARGQAIKAMACVLPEVTKMAAGMGSAAAVSEIDKHLLRIIDQWAERSTVPAPNAEPLRIAKPINDAFAATSTGAPPLLRAAVPKRKILEAFPPPAGVSKENWEKTLGDPPAWLIGARVYPGRRGKPSTWNPAQFALCLASEDKMKIPALTIIIRRDFPTWLPEWRRLTDYL